MLILGDIRPRGEMDITTVFGTVIGGSNPSGGMRAWFSGRTRPCQG